MFREFALKSGIRGFTYADTSNNLVKLMWYGIICVCAGMTINDVYGTVRYFMSFPTTTKVTLMSNDSINLGSPTVCIPYTNHLSNLKEFRNGTKAQIYGLLESTVKDYFVGTVNTSGADLEKGLVQTALSLIAAVVSSIVRTEHFTKNQTYKIGWGFLTVENQNDTTVITNEDSSQVGYAYRWLQHNNIPIKTATTVAIKLLCQQFSFTATDYWQTTYNCDIIEPTWLGKLPAPMAITEELFCFQLPSQLFTFGSDVELLYLQVRRPRMYQPEKEFGEQFVRLYFSGDPVQLAKGTNWMYHPVETYGSVKVTVAAQYKQLNRQQSPCSSDYQLSMCLFLCRKQFIRQWCNCTPLDVSASFQPLNECSVTHFISPTNPNCTKRTDQFIPAECSTKCHYKCDRQKFTFEKGTFRRDINETRILVYISSFDYPMFEEIPLLETKQILGSLGGNLSLYLGANFMLLYYTAFYWMTAAIAKLVNSPTVAGKL